MLPFVDTLVTHDTPKILRAKPDFLQKPDKALETPHHSA